MNADHMNCRVRGENCRDDILPFSHRFFREGGGHVLNLFMQTFTVRPENVMHDTTGEISAGFELLHDIRVHGV